MPSFNPILLEAVADAAEHLRKIVAGTVTLAENFGREQVRAADVAGARANLRERFERLDRALEHVELMKLTEEFHMQARPDAYEWASSLASNLIAQYPGELSSTDKAAIRAAFNRLEMQLAGEWVPPADMLGLVPVTITRYDDEGNPMKGTIGIELPEELAARLAPMQED